MYLGKTASAILIAATGFAILAGSPANAAEIPVETGAAPSQDVIALAPDGLDSALEELPTYIGSIMARSGVPGIAVAVVHEGRTVFAEGYGLRKIGKPEKVDADTVFQIASVSKPISATIAAIAVTRGMAAWDDPARTHLPSLRLSDPYVTDHATIGDFFSHRTGIPAGMGDELEDLGFGRGEIIRRLAQVPLDRFRASYHYANFGITIGAEAVAAAAGMAWEELAEDLLFAPLGMEATSFRNADYLARENRASLHAWENGEFLPLFRRNPDPQAPAGGVSSSANDLAEWMKLLLAAGMHEGEALISREALLPVLTPQAINQPAQDLDARSGAYGYGFNVGVEANGRPSFSHSGAFLLGAGTHMRIVPSADLGIVVLTNGGPVGVAEAIASWVLNIALYGKAQRDWYGAYHALFMGLHAPVGDLAGKTPPENPAPSRPLAEYAGHYDSAYFGPAEIRHTPEGLVLLFGPDKVELALSHWEGDRFAIAPRNENAPSGSLSSLLFEPGEGRIASFTVDHLNGVGLAVWTRTGE